MENKRKLNLIAVILNSIFTLACIIWLLTILIALNLNKYQIIEAVADLVASIIALMYLLEGYSKGVAKHYKISVLITALNALVVAILSTAEEIKVIPVIMCSIAFVILLILGLFKNLGKKVSYICCWIVLTIRILGFISILLTVDNFMDPSFSLIITQVALALTVLVVTYAKYVDKSSRNTD